MKVSVGWEVGVRLRQDPNKIYRGIVKGFILENGKRVNEHDLMSRNKVVCLARVEFHSDDERHMHIGGSIEDGFDEVYASRPPSELPNHVVETPPPPKIDPIFKIGSDMYDIFGLGSDNG